MKTLHLIDSLGGGGAERSLAELVVDLQARGFEPTVAHFNDSAEGIEAHIRAADIPVVRLESRNWVGRLREVRGLLRTMNPGVLHTTIFESDVIGRFAALGTDVTVLTSIVNTSYEPVRYTDERVRPAKLRLAQALDATSAHLRGDVFHAITNAVAESAVRNLRLRRGSIVVIPRGRHRYRLGEPSAERRAQQRDRLGLKNSSFTVLHVGREDHQKAHADVVAAFKLISTEQRDTTLILAGRRGNASAVVDKALAGVRADRVQRLGHVEDVPDLLSAADVFVFPSLYEGLGGAVLEAMAMEVPVVASDLPALREVLGPNALFVPPGDAPSLARAILEVAADPATARRRAACARKAFESEFEGDAIAARMVELFIAAPARAMKGPP